MRAEAEHPGSDIQEDSSGNAEALEESVKTAKEFGDIAEDYDHGKHLIYIFSFQAVYIVAKLSQKLMVSMLRAALFRSY